VIDLPPGLEWYFDNKRVMKAMYNVKDANIKFYYKFFTENDGSKETEFFISLKNNLSFGELPIMRYRAVVCPELAKRFSTQRKVLNSRMKDSPVQFYSCEWKNKEPIDRRIWIMNAYRQKIKQYEWNKDVQEQETAILPVVHGTDRKVANIILTNGFAALSKLDDGWYGKGIYFSTNAQYVIPYFATRKNPAIMICLLLPGNPYPVTESHLQKPNLFGQPLYGGHQSHFVITSPNGYPCLTDDTRFDEIVVDQEVQVVPIFVVEMDKDEIGQYIVSHPLEENKAQRSREIADSQSEIRRSLSKANTRALSRRNMTSRRRVPSRQFSSTSVYDSEDASRVYSKVEDKGEEEYELMKV